MSFMIGLIFHMVNMVLVLWEDPVILGCGYVIQGQKHVALLQTNEMPAGFHYRNWMLSM